MDKHGSVVKLSLNKLSDQPENAFKKVAMEFYLTEFPRDWLSHEYLVDAFQIE